MPEPPHDDHHGPPHDDHHGPLSEAPPGGRFLINDEQRRDVEQIGAFLESVGAELKDEGETEIGGQTIRPASIPYFVLRYERLPKGELKLCFEMEWDPRRGGEFSTESHDYVHEKTAMQTDGNVRDTETDGDGSIENR